MATFEKNAVFQGAHTLAGTAAEETPNQLRRILGLWDLVLMIIGTVIGSGIFLVPGAVLRAVGNSVPMGLTVWLAGGILSLLGALTYGELSSMKPRAGGLYVYIRDCFGPFPAFLFGWTLFFVISSGSIATLAVAPGRSNPLPKRNRGQTRKVKLLTTSVWPRGPFQHQNANTAASKHT